LQIGVQALLEAHPEASQQEYCHWWEAEHGMPVSRASMSRAIHGDWLGTQTGEEHQSVRAVEEELLSMPKLLK
jgi:hypothetical protein